MKEDEFKYLVHLLDNVDDSIFETLLQHHCDIEQSKPINEFNEVLIELLKENLSSNPVTTACLLQRLAPDSDPVQRIYINILNNQITQNKSIDKLMTLMCLIKWKDNFIDQYINDVLKPVAEENYRQYRKQILLSLIPQDRPELLSTAADLMHAHEPQGEFRLTPEYMIELCYQQRTHWLLKAAQVYKNQLIDIKNVTFKINNFTKQILILVLIELVNSPESRDLPALVRQLTNIYAILDTYTTHDRQLQLYLTEVKRELIIIQFCLENNCKIMTTSIFGQVLGQSTLAVVSQVCRLSAVDRYKVSRLLSLNNQYIEELRALSGKEAAGASGAHWDQLTYNGYCAVAAALDAVLGEGPAGGALDDVRRILHQTHPPDARLELLENVFACLFLRHEHLAPDHHHEPRRSSAHSDCSYFCSKRRGTHAATSRGAGFLCSADTAQLILNVLKPCAEELAAAGGERAARVARAVAHAQWKLQLVSALAPEAAARPARAPYPAPDDSSDEEEEEEGAARRRGRARRRPACGEMSGPPAHDFIAVMLAEPTCLVALALYHNDFSKANQILEMFDLADSEIATEVAFTEQLRNLVAKIKNMRYWSGSGVGGGVPALAVAVAGTEVTGLVEGFLAAHRAPSSLAVLELAARHPHLVLYHPRNAPLLNAVDVLLASGLDAHLTYGLVNVVERKLAEVRTSTHLHTLKKTNYILFVEDLASVTFEIFGNTDKSFEYVDNVCGLLVDIRIPIQHKQFCKMNQLSKELRVSCLDLFEVVDHKPKQEPLDQNILQKYHQIYMNVVAASDKDVCNVGEVLRHSAKKTRSPYLRMCYMYCRTVAQLERDDAAEPYFTVLRRPLSDIFGSMISTRDIPVTHLEPICKKLNVNLIPKLILNFCPSITLTGPGKEANEHVFNNLLHAVYDFKNPEENLFVEPVAQLAPAPRAPDAPCMTYIALHNWVLAHIIRKIHSAPGDSGLHHSIDARTRCLNNYMELDRFECTKHLFGNNKYLASLHTTVDLDKLFSFMPELIAAGKIMKCLNLIESLSERQVMCSTNLNNLRDLILFKLATNTNIKNNWKYCQLLKCPELKVNLILNNLSSWSGEGALHALQYLRFITDQESLEEGLYDKCSQWMVRIPLYEQIASIMGTSHWYHIYEKSIENNEHIIEVLLDTQQFKLCLEWADVHEVSEAMKNLIVTNLLKQLFEYPEQATASQVQELLSRLPTPAALQLVRDEGTRLRDVHLLHVCVQYMADNYTQWECFDNINIGLQIMTEIDTNLRHLFWELIEHPLLMIEQFLMNSKLDVLANILNKISPSLKSDPSGDKLYYNIKSIESLVISRNAVDALLRYYAEKALDMRTPREAGGGALPPRPPSDDALLQSIDSINVEAATRPFVMPERVPSKEQWAADHSTDRCMACRTAMFSVIIRRHHCRRCGRLVCDACSRRRMPVPTYPPHLRLRVCDHCYTRTCAIRRTSYREYFTAGSSASDSGGAGSLSPPALDWWVGRDAARNAALRDEFAYEFTPNVTLCLSIMKMHSINLDYPRFLLDRGEEVGRGLRAGGDARLLVRARRALLLAAAEIYSRNFQDNKSARVAEAGCAHAARCLAVADALATLVRHQLHHLAPQHTAHPSQIVRSLLEAEKWELALEIATKSGLPRNSVLAAWGKSCLKAGCFKQAREKFAHCFRSALHLCAEVTEECDLREPAEHFTNRRLQALRLSERNSSVSSAHSDGRPRSNPPLLNEIIAIIEDINYPVNPVLLHKAESIRNTNEKLASMNVSKKKIPLTEPALNIMHTLASVKKIKQGDYSDFQTGTVQPKKGIAQGLLRRSNNNEHKVEYTRRLDQFFYQECVYYLSNYGSHTANIAFYMKHSTLSEVLKYCYDNLVDKETFTDAVYMECLKRDTVDQLFAAMRDLDATLEMWAEYIMQACRALEGLGRLEALLVAQAHSGQNARAAATCARLYTRAAPRPPYRALHARRHLLARAAQHLLACAPVPTQHKTTDPKAFHFNLDKQTIDGLMTTVTRQIEVAKYLAEGEESGRLTERALLEVVPLGEAGRSADTAPDLRPLTLFGSNTDKIRLVALILATGPTLQAGFDLGFKIITEHKLDSMNIYIHVARYLVNSDRFMEVKALAGCIRDSNETAASLMSDQVLEAGVGAVVERCEARSLLFDEQAELLIQDVRSVATKISCYLVCRNVSSAYIVAARAGRSAELRRVLRHAERLGNHAVRNACLKRLANTTHASTDK